MTEPSGPLPTGFDLVERLRKAAIEADDMWIEDVTALFREAADAIDALREQLRDRGLGAMPPAGSA